MLLSLVSAAVAADTWGQFRGSNGSGVDTATGYPVEFSPIKNVVWKAAIPFGHSSPVIAGGKLFFTASEAGKLLTICLDAKTGLELWRREIKPANLAKIYKANDAASPTPVADRDGVVAFFPDFGLVAYGTDGKDRWMLPLGPFQNFYGMASSPILAGGKVILVADQSAKSFVIAVDRKSGKQIWKTERPTANIGWATPAVFTPSKGLAQLIVPGSTRVDVYSLATGELRWWMPVATAGSQGIPVMQGDRVLIAANGSGEPFMPSFESQLPILDKDKDGRLSAVEFAADKFMGDQFGAFDLDGDNYLTAKEWNEIRSMGVGEGGAFSIAADQAGGRIEPKSVVWRHKKNLPHIPAPLVYQNVFYLIRDGGIITTLNPLTGQVLKAGRNKEALGEYFASPVAADGKVYMASTEGKVTVLKAGGEWQVLATNDLAEDLYATPALSEGRVFVRTRGIIYCFGYHSR